jgi:hypothetical protein
MNRENITLNNLHIIEGRNNNVIVYDRDKIEIVVFKMKVVDIKDIDFYYLEMVDVLSSEGSLYFDNDLFYKFYDNIKFIKNKERKLMLLNNGQNNLNAVIPHILIKNKNLIYGCAMKYISESVSLIEYKKSDHYIHLIYDVSSSLKEIHNDPRNIAVGDLHFNNILVDKDMKHYFVDFDSCLIDGIPQDRLPRSLMTYIENGRGFCSEANKDTDRLCMILSLIHSLFGTDIDNINMNIYDEKAEKINTLKNLREYVIGIRNNTYGIPSLPYLHEIISESDFPPLKKIKNIK